MRKLSGYVLALCAVVLFSCSGGDDAVSTADPVTVDLAAVPYDKLSDYHFVVGNMRELVPSARLLPYKPASELFTDYAKKKRFIWMPENAMAQYNGDGNVLELPVGSVLIKNFYYDNTVPSGQTRIIETRLMTRKNDGWTFANYIWNDAQNEAFLDTAGATQNISWTDASGIHDIGYKIPSAQDCMTCHGNQVVNTPIGIKPQNLNTFFPYADGSRNQLQEMVDRGLLASIPQNVLSTIDWTDDTQPLELRVRSYLDINCAHCHNDDGIAATSTPRFAFNLTSNSSQMGVCLGSGWQIPGTVHGKIVAPQQPANSSLYYSMNTDNTFFRMPRIGRTIVHQEAVQLIGDWINSLPACP